MAQELLSIDKLQNFFENQRDYDISVLEKLEDDILMFPWISKIDLFQHWLYTHQNHTMNRGIKNGLIFQKSILMIPEMVSLMHGSENISDI
jgi:oligoendopeptidase F